MSAPVMNPLDPASPISRWGFGRCLAVALGVWTFLFLVLVVPFALLHDWKVASLPVVEGTLSQHRVVEVKRHKPRPTELWVMANLEFDRPSDHGTVPCKLDDVSIGPAANPQSFATRIELAVRTDSCHGYAMLPRDGTAIVREWVMVFLLVCVSIFIGIGIHSLARRNPRPSAVRRAPADAIRRSGPRP
jgi:hypothetical protein